MTVYNIECVLGMRLLLADSSVDAIVCDPPYELGFMGKSWDASGIAYSVEMWREALRVLKPGGHLLAFSGSRTYHRMACAIEDAGFEIRDQIMWVYGSGFPKSLDVSKAIDKAAGAEREVVGRKTYGDGHTQNSTESIGFGGCNPSADTRAVTAPATDAARQWDGWGTALKPAHEPICVARKPLIGTVAANVLAHGTGALNIDGCRVATTERASERSPDFARMAAPDWRMTGGGTGSGATHDLGRWPANLIHDGSDEVLAAFPETTPSRRATDARALPYAPNNKNAVFGTGMGGGFHAGFNDATGSAARFFYCPKASPADRDEGLENFALQAAGESAGRNDGSLGSVTTRRNTHPTVKPTALMQYLCGLVTPPGGLVLDPFTGSGSTGKAAKREGFQFVGFELSPEYAAIATARIAAA